MKDRVLHQRSEACLDFMLKSIEEVDVVAILLKSRTSFYLPSRS